jgi:hypothetical protein
VLKAFDDAIHRLLASSTTNLIKQFPHFHARLSKESQKFHTRTNTTAPRHLWPFHSLHDRSAIKEEDIKRKVVTSNFPQTMTFQGSSNCDADGKAIVVDGHVRSDKERGFKPHVVP